MIDTIFDWCVRWLVYLAGQFGMTYKAINVWIFVILWPIATLVLIGLVILQQLKIRQLAGRLAAQPRTTGASSTTPNPG